MRVPALSVVLILQCTAAPERVRISVEEYRDKVYASWLGQCVGNIYGLAHEQKYFFEPGPDRFPLGYSGWGSERMKRLNGAFSDDDTDIEYMYLGAMEAHGVEPTYADLASHWRAHVRKDVWLANRAAVAALRYGIDPPWTGRRDYNPHWFQIDPQLVNEIWAVTAPGMVSYAAAKSAWAARIMSDSWGIEPTIAYGAMYSAAFFESDTGKLIEIGKRALPSGARFAGTIDQVLAIHRKYPDDWKAARRELVAHYGASEPEATRTGTNANINGALGIMALLYGGGDFWRTLDLACALGFDADNQAATLAGLLGVANGTKGIPRALLFPFPEREWKDPLNDRYFNVTREALPDASIKDMAARTADLGARVIEWNGGRRIVENGVEYYEIAAGAQFKPAFEFPRGPEPVIEDGRPADHEFLAVCASSPRWRIVAGRLPPGLEFSNGRLSGTPRGVPGVYPITVEVGCDSQVKRREVKLLVRSRNLALTAARILAPAEHADLELVKKAHPDTPKAFFTSSVEAIRDGKRRGAGATFADIAAGAAPRDDAWGYEWQEPQKIGMVALTTGFIEETTGWFEALHVEYRDANGEWREVQDASTDPPFPAGEPPSYQAHFAEYLICFRPVETHAIRLIGPVGSAVKNKPRFTSVAELSVYAGPAPKR